MLRLATLLIVTSLCFAAYAEDCRQTPPITLHRDEPLDISVFFDNKPADATTLQLYAGDKLVHAPSVNQHGRWLLGLLPVGKYRVVIPHRATLDIVILPQSSGLNGDMISWFLFPKSRYKWVEGKQVAGKPCPVVVLKAD